MSPPVVLREFARLHGGLFLRFACSTSLKRTAAIGHVVRGGLVGCIVALPGGGCCTAGQRRSDKDKSKFLHDKLFREMRFRRALKVGCSTLGSATSGTGSPAHCPILSSRRRASGLSSSEAPLLRAVEFMNGSGMHLRCQRLKKSAAHWIGSCATRRSGARGPASYSGSCTRRPCGCPSAWRTRSCPGSWCSACSTRWCAALAGGARCSAGW